MFQPLVLLSFFGFSIIGWFRDGNTITKYIPDFYGMLDVGSIVRRLDEEFEKEIKASNRQKGFYCLKDNNTRLEYRSLPSSVFKTSLLEIKELLSRIKAAVEN